MGRSGVRADEEPVHRVLVSGFEMAATPVTNAHYRLYLGATGDDGPPFLDDPDFDAPDQPVVGVNFDQAIRFCDWLSRETGLPVRLPTEAEREKASRGGVEGAVFPWGDDPASGGHRRILSFVQVSGARTWRTRGFCARIWHSRAESRRTQPPVSAFLAPIPFS